MTMLTRFARVAAPLQVSGHGCVGSLVVLSSPLVLGARIQEWAPEAEDPVGRTDA
jgi:hypothetical protein